MTDKTSLGDRMKMYEQPTTSRKAFKGQPLVARLDGKSFHTFTKGLKRPYDERLSKLMTATMVALVDRFQASVGYTQSDEITLVWHVPVDGTREYPFDGRLQKIESLTASFAAAYFNKHLVEFLPEKSELLPIFDSRAFTTPNLREAYHEILWRQQDATKNAISMAAQSMFSHKSLQGLHGPEMQEKMWAEKGVNFNDYPPFFKRGVFAKRIKRMLPLSAESLARMPEECRAQWSVPGALVERSSVEAFDCWLAREQDAMEILFGDAESNPENYLASSGDKS